MNKFFNQKINKFTFKNFTRKSSGGFTLVETLVAIFILVLALNALLGLVASSLFSARYARNEITANYLIQEAIDSVRNDRDTMAFQHNNYGVKATWNDFLDKYGYDSVNYIPNSAYPKCFDSLPLGTGAGCEFEPFVLQKYEGTNLYSYIRGCDESPSNDQPFKITCDMINYDKNATLGMFYTTNYSDISGKVLPKANFKRKIIMSMAGPDELDVTVTVEWLNGNLLRTKSSTVSLLNWLQ